MIKAKGTNLGERASSFVWRVAHNSRGSVAGRKYTLYKLITASILL